MNDPDSHPSDGDPEIGRLVRQAYWRPTDVETASRHLWRLHQVAGGVHGARNGARRTLVSALAAVLLFATTGAAVAFSGHAVPGDSLYPVKRGAERVHLLVSFAPESDARLHLRFARSRVTEVQRVAGARPDQVPALLSQVVASVDRAQAVGGPELHEEVELVRREVTTALSTLGAALDQELAGSFDATLEQLAGGSVAAVDGDGTAPPREEAPEQPAGDEPAAGAGTPTGPRPSAPLDPPGERHGADLPRQRPDDLAPTTAPAPESTAGPTPEATLGPAPGPSTEPDGGGSTAQERGTAAPAEAPAGTTAQGATPAAPAPSQEAGAGADTAMPALDRLEGLLQGD